LHLGVLPKQGLWHQPHTDWRRSFDGFLLINSNINSKPSAMQQK